MTAPSKSPFDAPRKPLSGPESAQDPSAGTERRPGGPNGPQAGTQSLGAPGAAPHPFEHAGHCDACLRAWYGVDDQPSLADHVIALADD